jgi:coproporphyrinogen III oxidase-like Fe-S oxidoreductase
VEEGTPFHRWQEAGKLDVPEESEDVGMLTAASSLLTKAGFEHYEISNYAKAGHKSRHNLVYWLGHGYYAFGVGAASFLAGRRMTRPKTLAAWGRYVDSLEEVEVPLPHDDSALPGNESEEGATYKKASSAVQWAQCQLLASPV